MKLKKTFLKPLIIVLALLILALIILAIFFLTKSQFLQPAFKQQPATSSTPTVTPLVDPKFGARDPNLNNEQNLIKDYVASHLSDLSPTKEVVGGKFYLTDIKFDGQQTTISYEDGHIALQATLNYELSPQELKITDFKITKEN